jgi:integron integrase
MRTRHLSLRTEQAYLQWLRRYIAFHGRKHPRELGAPEVEQFLTFLAVRRKVSAATQNQALQALLFLYRHVLEIELPWLANVTRATRPKRLPVVLSRTDAHALLAQLQGAPWLVASLLYGSGLRLMEALRLRVKDIALERGELIVREAKGGKDRVTMLPASLDIALRAHLARLRSWYEEERRRQRPGVTLPTALARKYPRAGTQWGWQYLERSGFRIGAACAQGRPMIEFNSPPHRPLTRCRLCSLPYAGTWETFARGRHASYPASATAFERLRLRLPAAASRPVRSDR